MAFKTLTSLTAFASIASFASAQRSVKPCFSSDCGSCGSDNFEVTAGAPEVNSYNDLSGAGFNRTSSSGGLNVWWDVSPPGGNCAIIIYEAYSQNNGTSWGNVVLEARAGGCYYANMAGGAWATQFCCGAGDCGTVQPGDVTYLGSANEPMDTTPSSSSVASSAEPSQAPTDVPSSINTSLPTDAPTTSDPSAPTDAPTSTDPSVPTDTATAVDTSIPTDAATSADPTAPTDVATSIDPSAPTDGVSSSDAAAATATGSVFDSLLTIADIVPASSKRAAKLRRTTQQRRQSQANNQPICTNTDITKQYTCIDQAWTPAPPSCDTVTSDTYQKSGDQQQVSATVNCNVGSNCALLHTNSITITETLTSDHSVTTTTSNGVSVSINAGFSIGGANGGPGFSVGADVGYSHEWSKAIADSTGYANATATSATDSYTFSPPNGVSGFISFTPALECKSQAVTCDGATIDFEHCTPLLTGDKMAAGDYMWVTVGGA